MRRLFVQRIAMRDTPRGNDLLGVFGLETFSRLRFRIAERKPTARVPASCLSQSAFVFMRAPVGPRPLRDRAATSRNGGWQRPHSARDPATWSRLGSNICRGISRSKNWCSDRSRAKCRYGKRRRFGSFSLSLRSPFSQRLRQALTMARRVDRSPLHVRPYVLERGLARDGNPVSCPC
jgi:hypothetical protein